MVTGYLRPASFEINAATSYEMAIALHIAELRKATARELKQDLLPILPLKVNEKLLENLEAKGILVSEDGTYETATNRLPEQVPYHNETNGSLRVGFLQIGHTIQPLDCALVNEPLWWEKKGIQLSGSHIVRFAQRKSMRAKFGPCPVYADKPDKIVPVRLVIYLDRTELHLTDNQMTTLPGVTFQSVLGHDFDFENRAIGVLNREPEASLNEPFEINHVSLRGEKYTLEEPLRLRKIPT